VRCEICETEEESALYFLEERKLVVCEDCAQDYERAKKKLDQAAPPRPVLLDPQPTCAEDGCQECGSLLNVYMLERPQAAVDDFLCANCLKWLR
jgi:ribosome-binding protein aMBF1 (putative translation factor)